MATSQQQLAFAIRAVNEASATLKQVQGDIDRAGKSALDADASTGKFSGALASVGKIASGFVVAQGLMQLPGLFMSTTSAGSDLNETLSKANTVFGDQGKAIEDWSGKLAKGFGLSKQEALSSAGSLGNMFTQLGIGQEQAAGMSQKMVELAADFNSFHNPAGGVAEVLAAQESAFRGEYDAVQKFVPTINAAAVQQKAMEMGLASTTKELDAQDKALATQALLLEGAGAAAGDYARTQDSAANKTRSMQAQIANLQGELGTKLLPVQLAVVTAIVDQVIPAFQRFIAFVGPGVKAAMDVALPLIRSFGEFFVEHVLPRIREFGALASEKFAEFAAYYQANIAPTLASIIAGFSAIVGWVHEHWPEIMAVIGPMLELLKNAFSTAFSVVTGLIDSVIKLLNGDFAGAWNAFGGVVGAVFDGIKNSARISR